MTESLASLSPLKGMLLDLFSTAITLPVLPLALAQAALVRWRTPPLPEATGARTGLLLGQGSPWHITALGESTVAGVGTPTYDGAIGGQTATHLHRLTGRTISWLALGRKGVTSEDALEHLVPLLRGTRAHMVLLVLGVNDVLRLHSPSRWSQGLERVILAIREHLRDVPIVVAGIPPLAGFPSLPQPLGVALGIRAMALNLASAHLARTMPGVHHCPTPAPSEDSFASDRFHPGPKGYTIWGEHLAGCIARMVPTPR